MLIGLKLAKAPVGALAILTLSQLITSVASAGLLLFKVMVPEMTSLPGIGVAWLVIGPSNKANRSSFVFICFSFVF